MNSPYLTVISNDTRPKVQGDVNQEERVREHVEPLPAHAALAVQESNLHGDPDQVQKGNSHHAHDIITPNGGVSTHIGT